MRFSDNTGGFEFDTAGIMKGTPQIQSFYHDRKSEIINLLDILDQQKIRICGCMHEVRFASRYSSRLRPISMRQRETTPPDTAGPALCDERELNPLCAHNGRDFSADPLGIALEKFDSLRMLDSVSWGDWHQRMARKIAAIDHVVQRESFLESPHPENAVAEAREQQEVLKQEINTIRDVLRACVAIAIARIDAYNK